MYSNYLGAIFGLAIGDALGFPTEFMNGDEIRAQFGPEGITDFQPSATHPAGTYSDDTQMTLALARALIRAGHSTSDVLMATVSEELVAWAFGPDNDSAAGNTCMAGCHRLREGVSWQESGVQDSKGCGSAMRSAPIGLYYHGDTSRIVEVGIAISQITHGHPCALAGSVATAYLVNLALDDLPPEDAFASVVELTAPISQEFVEKLQQVPSVLAAEPEEAFGVLGEGWVAEEAVAAGLYCFWRSPRDYGRTVLTGANATRDSDSIAYIAGAISGAYNGIEAIPVSWRRDIENADELEGIAARIQADP